MKTIKMSHRGAVMVCILINPSQSLRLQYFPMGDNIKNVLECNTLR